MIRQRDLQDRLLHLVGWENEPSFESLISENINKSESGLYFQQVHPLLTLSNLSSIAPNFNNIVKPNFDINKKYKKDEVVSYEQSLYKALKECQRIDPTNDEYWVETNLFSEWLEDKTKASIYKAVMRFYNEKIVAKTASNLVESKTLFDGTGRIVNTIANRHDIVGFEIIPIRANGITTKINKIGLQFTEPGEYTLYLMHSSMDVPVKVIRLNKVRKNSIEWFTVDDVYMPYQSDNNDAGGSWFLCYLQSELPEGSQAIRKDKDWSKGPCSGCSRREFSAWQAWSKYIEVHPFRIDENLVDCVDFSDDYNNDFNRSHVHMWDIELNDYDYTTNYGLNLDITIECDITDFIIEQRHQFVDIISKQLAIDMLREFAYNPNVRTNRHSINASRTDILYEIDGDSSSMKKSGLSYQLEVAYKAIELAFTGIDRVCQPCRNNGIRYRTV